jgi:hypothetical protein
MQGPTLSFWQQRFEEGNVPCGTVDSRLRETGEQAEIRISGVPEQSRKHYAFASPSQAQADGSRTTKS